MVKPDVIQRLLNNLESYVTDLKNAGDITYQKFMSDVRSQRFVERTLQLVIETCFDIAHHIISDEDFRESESYTDVFTVLAENNILPPDSLNEYRPMAQFRNKIVHHYETVEPEQVFAIFTKHLDTFDRFRDQIISWLHR